MNDNTQPKVLINAMDEIMTQNHQFSNQQRVILLIQTWQQKAEIEGLKREIGELKQHIIELNHAEE